MGRAHRAFWCEGLIGVSIAVFTAVTAYTQQTDRRIMQQCTTLYGRQVRAYAASDDYFGQQLSKTIAGEAKECAEYASTKRASDVTASTLGAIDAAQDSSTEDLSSRIRKPYTPARATWGVWSERNVTVRH